MRPLDKLLVSQVHTNQLTKVAQAISRGANVNCGDGLPLITAAYMGHKKMLKLLCNAKAEAGLAKAIEIVTEAGRDDLLVLLNEHEAKLANKRLRPKKQVGCGE